MINLKKDISVIWDWLNIVDKPKKSDLIFIFGGAVLSLPQKGLELFNSGLAPYILVTGKTGTSTNPDWTKPIANVFADYLVKNGIDSSKIIIQNESTNTPEDILFSLPLLKNKNIKIKSIILVARPMHQKRAYATFKKQFPYPVEIFNQPCFETHPKDLTETELLAVATRCLQECDRLVKYAQKGDIEKVIIPPKINDIFNKLKTVFPI